MLFHFRLKYLEDDRAAKTLLPDAVGVARKLDSDLRLKKNIEGIITDDAAKQVELRRRAVHPYSNKN